MKTNARGHKTCRWPALVTVVLGAGLYIGSYLYISRVSLGYVRDVHGEGCYFAPVSVDTLVRSGRWRVVHEILTVVYYPAWVIDYYLLGGPGRANIPLMDMKGKTGTGVSTV